MSSGKMPSLPDIEQGKFSAIGDYFSKSFGIYVLTHIKILRPSGVLIKPYKLEHK